MSRPTGGGLPSSATQHATGHRLQARSDCQSDGDAGAELRGRAAEDAGEHTAGIGAERGADADLAAPRRVMKLRKAA